MKERAAVEAAAHHLRDPDERGRLPVALGAEAVAVRHQPLRGDARQLSEAVEILEGVGEGPEPARVEEAAQTGLDPGGVAQGLAAVASLAERGREVVLLLVRRHELIHLRVGDRPRPPLRAASDAVAVDGHAQPDLRLDLVALR